VTKTISPHITRIEEKIGQAGVLAAYGYCSVFDIARQSRQSFIRQHQAKLRSRAALAYDLAVGQANQIRRLFRKSKLTASRQSNQRLTLSGQKSMSNGASSVQGLMKNGPTWQNQFADDWSNHCQNGAPEADDSPVAYLTWLYNQAILFEQGMIEKDPQAPIITLATRRPDLSVMQIDNTAINQIIPSLELVNEILTSSVTPYIQSLGSATVEETLSTTRYPTLLPYHFPHDQTMLSLANAEVALPDIIEQTDPSWPYFLSDKLIGTNSEQAWMLGSELAPEQQTIITEPDNSQGPDLTAFYQSNLGLNTPNYTPFTDSETFTHQVGVTVPQLEQLISTTAGGTTVVVSANVTNDGSGSAPVADSANYGAAFINIHTEEPVNLIITQHSAYQDDMTDGSLTVASDAGPYAPTITQGRFNTGVALFYQPNSYLQLESAVNGTNGTLNGAEDYTIGFWLNVAELPSSSSDRVKNHGIPLLANVYPADGQTGFFLNLFPSPGKLRADAQSNSTSPNSYKGTDSVPPIELGQWFYVALTWVASKQTLTLFTSNNEGMVVPSPPATITEQGSFYPGSGHCWVFNESGDTSRPFYTDATSSAGSFRVDDIAIWNKALNNVDIQAIVSANQPVGAQRQDMTYYYPLDQLKPLTLINLSDARMDRINRMVRLQRWLELPYDQVDLLLTACIEAQGTNNTDFSLNTHTLRMLGVFRHYQQHYHVTAYQFAAVLHHITPYAIAPAVPFFDQIFNSPSLFANPFVIDGAEFDYTAQTCTTKQICAGLNITEAQFQVLASQIATAQGKPDSSMLPCSLDVVSAFYRLVMIPRWLGLTFAEGAALFSSLNDTNVWAALAGVPQLAALDSTTKQPEAADILDILMALGSAASWAKAHNLSWVNNYLTLQKAPSHLVATTNILNFVNSINQQLSSVLLTEMNFVSVGLPTSQVVSGTPQSIDWMATLSDLIDKHGLIKPVAPAVDASVYDTLYEAVTNDIKSKSIAVPTMTSEQIADAATKVVYQAMLTQNGIADSAIAQLFNTSQSLSTFLLQWAGSTEYQLLSQTLALQGITTVDKISSDYLQALYPLGQRAAITTQFSLTPAMMSAFLANPTWFGVNGTTISLTLLYRFSRYADWLTQAIKEDSILAYLAYANQATPDANQAASMLASLLDWDSTQVNLATQTFGASGIATTVTDVDGVMRLQTLANQTGLSVTPLLATGALTIDSTYSDWQSIGESLVAAQASSDTAALLNQHQRNALLAYYLGQYVPNSSNTTLASLVQSPEDVYEYLLIDPLVTNAVPTSRVAQAVSSIQQYINGITLNMEPGYNTHDLDSDQLNQWQSGANQYNIWAGEVELDTYPEDYIDPTLRQSQTQYFESLTTTLNQNAINYDTVQKAVMGYLNDFEQVANLDIVSGYLNSSDQTQGIYYLLGKTQSAPTQYYWRSFNMDQNIDNVVSTSAWSQWYAMNISINEDALVGTIRPVYFNNRLYIFWFEKTQSGTNIKSSESSDDSRTYYTLSAYSSYCDFSNNWSAPHLLASIDNATLTGDDATHYSPLFKSDAVFYTMGLYYQSDNSLAISLYTNKDGTDYHDFSLYIDYWFNIKLVEAATSSGKAKNLGVWLNRYSTVAEQARIQNIASDITYQVAVGDISASHDDFGALQDLPILEESDFSVANNSDGSLLTLQGSIPALFNTANYPVRNYNYPINYDSEHVPANPDSGVLTFKLNGQTVTDLQFTDMLNSSDPSDYSLSAFGASPGYISILLDPAVDADEDGYVELSRYPFDLPSSSAEGTFNFWGFTHVEDTLQGLTFTSNYDLTDVPTSWNFAVYSGAWNSGAFALPPQGPKDNFSDSLPPFSFHLHIVKPTTDKSTTQSLSFGYYKEINNNAVWATYPVTIAIVDDLPDTPYITHGTNVSGLGSAVYLDFRGGKFGNKTKTPINPIRLNTLFAKELINKASLSINALLNWDTQLTPEPPMTKDDLGKATPMDFHGANGIYFWELFFYMPYLVAYRLNQEQQYDAAQSWYHYIFDPAARDRTSNPDYPQPDYWNDYPQPDYWNVRPLVEGPASQALPGGLTTDPDAIASAYPEHYQKAIFMAYVNNLIAAGDADYRQLTNDAISLAKLRYCQAKDLLGPRPNGQIVNHWQPNTLQALISGSAQQSVALFEFEQTMGASSLPLFPGAVSAAMTTGMSSVFMTPVNTQLLQYWDTIDSRLYNLRHNLTIDGLPMNIPLYAPPVNPTLLMQQSSQGGSLANAVNGVVATIPPYRFRTMLQSALAAVSTLTQLGQTLLSYCERGEAAGLQELNQQQLFNLSSFTLTLQRNAVEALTADQKALTASRELAQQRYDYYDGLYTAGISGLEIAAMVLRDSSATLATAAAPFMTAGMAMETLPNIFGLADGGQQLGAPSLAAGIALQLSGEVTGIAAQQTEMSASYSRRSEEWQFQSQQAQLEVNVIDQQLAALAIRQQAAQTALEQAVAQQAAIKSTLDYLTTRFTQASLYTWLTGQLSALYYQAYDAVLSLCLSTQACWQYEMGDITTFFIQTNAWNNSYRGLLVGETLQLNLHQMESAWLNRNQRRLELTKTISLKQDIVSADEWDAFIKSGKLSFSLSEQLFDNDYPGHYLRQLKFVTVTLPVLLGPYQDVCMTLTQSSSSVLLTADINGVRYLNGDTSNGNPGNILPNPRANQQVAISSGLNDSGLFTLNFGDERYLPFEGTGAVSSWQLAFPNPSSDKQQAILASLNDVIIQVHYTALDGGATFADAVSSLDKSGAA
jgi:hypothetical protein